MAPRSPRSSKLWICHGCQGKDCGHGIPVGTLVCSACGNVPPKSVSCPDGLSSGGRNASAKAKAKAKAGAKGRGPQPADADQNNDLAKQLKLVMAAHKTLEAKYEKLEKLKAPAPLAVDAPMDLDSDEPANAALDKRIEEAKAHLAELQATPPFTRSKMPDFEALLTAATAEVEQAKTARQASKPLQAQFDGAKGYQGRMRKKLDGAKSLLEAQRLQLAELQSAIAQQEATVAESEAICVLADAKVAKLAADIAAGEGATNVSATATASAAPNAFVPPEGAGPDWAPHGFVSVAFAEAKWAESEQLWQQRVLALLPAEDEASVAAASDLGDLKDVDDPTDDGVWTKIDRTKRGKLLRKSGDSLARSVRLGITKVSTGHSVFKKS